VTLKTITIIKRSFTRITFNTALSIKSLTLKIFEFIIYKLFKKEKTIKE